MYHAECDALYLSKTAQMPVIIDFQGKVNHSFLKCAINYYLDGTQIRQASDNHRTLFQKLSTHQQPSAGYYVFSDPAMHYMQTSSTW